MKNYHSYKFVINRKCRLNFVTNKNIFLIVLVLFSYNLSAQQKTDTITKDSIIKPKQPIKIRLGFDIGKYAWAKLNSSESYDLYIDANFYKSYYIVLSYGQEKHFTDNNLLNFHTTGYYYKMGLMYNLYDNWLDMDNDIDIGFNYAYARFDYLLHSYRINQPGAIFEPNPIQIDQSFNQNKAQWFELYAQIQVETIKHVYLGYNIGLKYLINYSDIENFTAIYIPGFFNRNTYSRFGFGMQYFISYRLIF